MITGIGSLPHLTVEAALEYSFRHDIPYLPQLPMETMLIHSLGNFNLAPSREEILQEALSLKNFAPFLPSPDEILAFQPFLSRLSALKKGALVKIQVCEPFTCLLLLSADPAAPSPLLL